MARKAWQLVRACALGLVTLSLATSTLPSSGASAAPAPAAGIGDALFEKVKGLILGSVDPDAIEMARFSIEHPEHAATIYMRGAAQDYPFFGMIGAVKVARKAGFSHEKCMTPILAIDSVFAKSSATISEGKTETDDAMGAASAIAAEYGQAANDQAKQKLVEQLSATVPYFGDIPVICDFAFETDFQKETDIQNRVNQVSQDIRTAYYAFKSGDVVTGVAVLAALGASEKLACEMVDGAVLGGMIGRTPILGALAKGACAGFVGSVIDGFTGLVKGGVGFVEAGVKALAGGAKTVGCAIYSLIGSGCSEAPPPPTASGNAGPWCSAHGGVREFSTVTNAADDFIIACNNGLECRQSPGTAVQCATAAEIAARIAQEIAMADGEFQALLPQWQASFEARWSARCPDEACKAGVRVVRLNATQLATNRHAAEPRVTFHPLTYLIFEAADRQAVSVIEELRYRVLPGRWAERFVPRWNERCEDNQCRVAVKIIAANVLLQVQQKAAATPRPAYGSTAAAYALAEKQGAALVAESVQRIADFNKANTAVASVAWENTAIDFWGRQCSDAPCFPEIKQLAALMRIAANLNQASDTTMASLQAQNSASLQYGPKFKAAVVASAARAAAKVPAVPAFKARAPGPIQPYLQPVRRGPAKRVRRVPYDPARGAAPVTRGRPAPIDRPVPPPAPPVRRPGPVIRPIPIRPVPAPAAPIERPRTGRIVVPAPAPTPKPTPSPTPTPRGRPAPTR